MSLPIARSAAAVALLLGVATSLRAQAAPSRIARANSGGAPRAAVTSPVATDDSLVLAIHDGGTRYATARVALWVGRGALDDSAARRFLADADRAVAALGELLGRSLDRAHYREDTLQLLVGDGIGVSHVYGGYSHPQYDRPFLFLDAARVRSGEAPYVHESTHLLAWRFGAHSLREGVASWAEAVLLEREVVTGSGLFGMRNLAAIDERAAELVNAEWVGVVLAEVGEPGLPDPAVTSPQRPKLREAYYVLSTSFTKFLVTKVGVRRTIAAMEAETADGFAQATGRAVGEWKAEWLSALR